MQVWDNWFKTLETIQEPYQYLDDLFIDIRRENNVKYCIASLSGDSSTLLHEYAHAHYHLNIPYQQLITEIYESLIPEIRSAIEKELTFRNYQQSVFKDEFQAYLIENCNEFGIRFNSKLRPLHIQLRKIISMPALETAFEFMS
jgi:hypothetical protein